MGWHGVGRAPNDRHVGPGVSAQMKGRLQRHQTGKRLAFWAIRQPGLDPGIRHRRRQTSRCRLCEGEGREPVPERSDSRGFGPPGANEQLLHPDTGGIVGMDRHHADGKPLGWGRLSRIVLGDGAATTENPTVYRSWDRFGLHDDQCSSPSWESRIPARAIDGSHTELAPQRGIPAASAEPDNDSIRISAS